MNFKQLQECFSVIIKSSLVPVLVGKHGVGKSQSIKQLAEHHKVPFIDLRLSLMADSGDLTGLPDFIKNSKGQNELTSFMRPEWFPSSGKGILFLDEINRATRDILQAVFQLTLDKRIHNHKLPPLTFNDKGEWVSGWAVVAAMNPPTDEYVVTDLLDEALIDRLCFIKFEPSLAEYKSFCKKHMSEDFLSFISAHPDMFSTKMKDFNLSFIKPSNRSFFELAQVKQNTSDEVFEEIAMGVMGLEGAKSLITHLEKHTVRLTGADVLKGNFEKQTKVLVENNRMDVLNGVITDVNTEMDELVTKGKDFTEKQMEHFYEFSKLLPLDMVKPAFKHICISSKTCRVVLGKNEKEFFSHIEKVEGKTK